MGNREAILFIVFAIFFLIFVVGIIILALRWENKKKGELIARCTVSIQGTLIGIAQSYYSHIDNNEQVQYNYNPIVRYEFGGKTYEKTYSSTSSWEDVQPERTLTIFVNPNNANEIYVPLPEDVKKDRNKKTKIFLIVFFIWILIGLIGGILMAR
ncbi:MAG: DUF3592 domain-containing protein [Lachnospiraceae bacterium]|nr:DUF3592 domain-containing protein [Lachnospiraceae bacterium]